MALDIKTQREKIRGKNPKFNLIPLIDILFTILIFLVVASSFNSTDLQGSGSGKPNMTDTSGNSEYYLIPVANLEKVTVNGQDMSYLIRDNSIAVHSKVIDQGEIIIKPKNKSIIITAPENMNPNEAIHSPN